VRAVLPATAHTHDEQRAKKQEVTGAGSPTGWTSGRTSASGRTESPRALQPADLRVRARPVPPPRPVRRSKSEAAGAEVRLRGSRRARPGLEPRTTTIFSRVLSRTLLGVLTKRWFRFTWFKRASRWAQSRHPQGTRTTRPGHGVRTLASPWRSGSAVALPLGLRLGQSRRPALAEIIGARRMCTVAMISSGSIP
jgi:hypothetical protein